MNVRLPNDVLPPIAEAHTKWRHEHVLSIRHWTPRLMSFRITRPADFNFVPGRYARLGLADETGEVAWRPFSMVSPASENYLEFLVVLIEGGQFSRRVTRLAEGDEVLIERLSYGFLTLDQLAPGRNLWLIASGSGLGPFVSMLADPATWQGFERIVVVHSARHADELAYRDEIEASREGSSAAGSGARLAYIPVLTRDPHAEGLHARIPLLVENGQLETAAGVALEKGDSRAMVCGNPDLAQDMRTLLKARGFTTSRRNAPGQMAFEKYW
ncbi:MAG TPA: ferredoxin--NADP reductase [Rhodocyclaceae bacterium]|nr:ferredoxin--NADP reductase [Rhodocyclaceae bacterium]